MTPCEALRRRHAMRVGGSVGADTTAALPAGKKAPAAGPPAFPDLFHRTPRVCHPRMPACATRRSCEPEEGWLLQCVRLGSGILAAADPCLVVHEVAFREPSRALHHVRRLQATASVKSDPHVRCSERLRNRWCAQVIPRLMATAAQRHLSFEPCSDDTRQVNQVDRRHGLAASPLEYRLSTA